MSLLNYRQAMRHIKRKNYKDNDNSEVKYNKPEMSYEQVEEEIVEINELLMEGTGFPYLYTTSTNRIDKKNIPRLIAAINEDYYGSLFAEAVVVNDSSCTAFVIKIEVPDEKHKCNNRDG
jgi:hypothetical protein